MSTPTPPRFRFSLLTLLVAVNMAGVLVWANVSASNSHSYNPVIVSHDDSPDSIREQLADGRARAWGWPVIAAMRGPHLEIPGGPYGPDFSAVLADLGVAMLILLGVTLNTERLVRKLRRPGEPQDEPPAGQPQEPVDA